MMSPKSESQLPLLGQVALVTGGASGIGRACALELAARGCAVVVADLSLDSAETTCALIRDRQISTIPAEGDVSHPGEVERIFETAMSLSGRIDILVHSAGIGIERLFLETADSDWNRVINVDLSGTFNVMRAAGRLMSLVGYGRIIVLSSTAGIRGGTGRAAYGAAKGGVNMLTKVMAVELAEKGVTVNAIAPGAIETELVQRMHSAETRRNYTRSIPVNRYGTPEEVAFMAAFLADPRAAYITGTVLPVDGGFTAAGIINRELHS